jgi:hypothetical protein
MSSYAKSSVFTPAGTARRDGLALAHKRESREGQLTQTYKTN